MLYKLFKLLNSSSLNASGVSINFKKGPKAIAKSLLWILLFLYVFGVMIVMYTLYMIGTYRFLAANGNQQFMPIITMLLSIAVIMFFGFTSVASTYYTGKTEELIMCLPISNAKFFEAKFAVSFVSDAIMGVGMFTLSSIVYGYNEGLLTNPLFYLGFLVSALAFSVISVFIIYLLFILILYFIPALRKKKLLTVVATILIIIFCMFYGFLNSSVSLSVTNPEFINQKMGDSIEKIFQASSKAPALMYIAGALNGKIVPILILAALGSGVLFGLVPLVGGMYVKSLNGFSDVKSKKISTAKAEEVINKDVRSVSVFHALFVRDYRNVVREPAFFANGPLFVYLFPVIFVLSFSIGFIASGAGLGGIIMSLKEEAKGARPEILELVKYIAAIGGAGFTIFSGTFANLATTSFSREGKSLNDLKAMPLKFNMIVKVKFWHAMLYVGIADVISIIIVTAAYLLFEVPLSIFELVSILIVMTILAAAVSLLLIFIDMFIDTAHPKLNWENPMTASKQNLNVLWSMLLSMLTIGVVILLLVFVLPKKLYALVILSAIYAIIAAPIGAGYFKYAEKRLKDM